MKKINVDKIFVGLSLTYLILPICIFLFGWLKAVYAFIFSLFFIYLAYRLLNSFSDEVFLFKKKDIIYWLLVIIILFIWVYFSGIGGFSYQNDDFWARNAIFRDLINYDWPVIYDLAKEPDYVISMLGTSEVAFSYYYIFWLPIAFLAKLFNLSWEASNILLFLYVIFGLFLTIYNLNRKFKRCLYIVPLIFVLFSGLDVIYYYFINRILPAIEHIEWYGNYYFQYSANTTQLYWIFNQSVPLWLLMSLFINMKDNKYLLSLCALCFAYSPWAMIGLLPYMAYITFKKKDNFKEALNLINIVGCLLMLIIFASFYYCGIKGSNAFHLSFAYFLNDQPSVIKTYLLFILLEVGLYLILIKKDEYYLVTCLCLLFIPFIQDDSLNFCMRVSLPSLFMLMFFVIDSLVTINYSKVKKIILVVLLLVGAYTSYTEIERSIVNKRDFSKYMIRDEIYSFGDIRNNNKEAIEIISDQFFAYDYKNSFFFKYLAKRGDA